MIQHATDVFWIRWSMEYIPLLQKRQKWIKNQRNMQVGDLVLVVDNNPRNLWTMARVSEIHGDDKGLVRAVTVKTRTGTLQRPIHKLVLLLEADG